VAGHVAPLLSNRAPILIADRVSSAPSATAGVRYIVAAAFDSYLDHQIIEGNGSSFNVYTPPTDCGWVAYVQDEDTYYHFIGSAWVIDYDYLVGLVLPGAVVAIIEDQKTQNTAAQTLSTGSDQIRELNTLVYNRNTLVSLSSNRFTLPAGTWEIEWSAPIKSDNGNILTQSFLYNQTDSTVVRRGASVKVGVEAGNAGEITTFSAGRAVVTITGAKAFEIRQRVSANRSGGAAANFGIEVYTRVTVRKA
jgi:hypothetical protein